GARLAKVDYIPAFPITPQTEIIETLGKWIDDGEIDSRMVTMESEHSMVTAAGSASVTGVRVYTATSSQGLLYAMEMLYNASGWRAPFVMTNVSRGLAAPITLESDHNDIMAARDSGFLQIHCTTCQEVLDSTLMAYRLAEDPRVRLPVIVNLDGFYLSFTREPVEIPDADLAAKFVGEFDAENIRFRASSPASQAVAVLGGTPYSYFRYELHLAAMKAVEVYDEVAADFRNRFGRAYPAVESYHSDDADYAFVMLGSFASKAKEAVDRLREDGWSIGLVRPRLLRPFPFDAIRTMLAGKKGLAVIDQNISMGMGGVLHSEICSAMYAQDKAPKAILSFIGGLGGRDISAEEFYEMAKEIRDAVNSGKCPPPRLLYTRNELREVTKLQAIAQVERVELGTP
ncbi:MAG: pyruvate synthase, partial [Gammaproteobacteria bacterium]|nr:pyruvate synthase [Gammaproteobacteria bacterium]